MEANGTEQLPVQPGMDTLILNWDAAEREEADPAKKKKKKKKKSKSAASGECLIRCSKCCWGPCNNTAALNTQLCLK